MDLLVDLDRKSVVVNVDISMKELYEFLSLFKLGVDGWTVLPADTIVIPRYSNIDLPHEIERNDQSYLPYMWHDYVIDFVRIPTSQYSVVMGRVFNISLS